MTVVITAIAATLLASCDQQAPARTQMPEEIWKKNAIEYASQNLVFVETELIPRYAASHDTEHLESACQLRSGWQEMLSELGYSEPVMISAEAFQRQVRLDELCAGVIS